GASGVVAVASLREQQQEKHLIGTFPAEGLVGIGASPPQAPTRNRAAPLSAPPPPSMRLLPFLAPGSARKKFP
ncbi:MAG: hypothetical protein M3357_15460, partial [Actinomycetota bacterium]|nr:hypothetical protein [Actinomycetota bacterium]